MNENLQSEIRMTHCLMKKIAQAKFANEICCFTFIDVFNDWLKLARIKRGFYGIRYEWITKDVRLRM